MALETVIRPPLADDVIKKAQLLEVYNRALKSVTEMFGDPVKGFTVEELAYTESKMEIAYWHGRPEVLILNVNKAAYNDTNKQLYFQVGHEITHTLGPMGHSNGRNATIIEEGCAEYHARQFTGDNTGDYSMASCGQNYLDARDLADKLVNQFGLDSIKKIRSKQPFLSKLTKKELVSVFPDIDDALAEQLVSPFPY